MTRHFDRSGRADQVASHLGPKPGMFLGTVLRIPSKLCNLVCKIGKLGLILELAFWTLLAPLSFACSIVSLAVSCLCNMECSDADKIEGWLRFMFGFKSFSAVSSYVSCSSIFGLLSIAPVLSFCVPYLCVVVFPHVCFGVV